MTVFVVSAGEKYEGGGIIGIFASYDDARRAAFAQSQLWDKDTPEIRPNYWENAYDWVSIREINVIGA